jgi:hypothetical protein
MMFKTAVKVGDLVRVRECEGDTRARRLGAGLVVDVEKNPLDQTRRFPVIQVKFFKTDEIMRFIEKDLEMINEG